MTRHLRPMPALTPRRPDDVPCVVHGRPYGQWTPTGVVQKHPCGVTAERGVTLTVGPSGPSDNGTWCRARPVNCPSCVEANERHSAACAAVRSGR
jgi:hypothetical protein